MSSLHMVAARAETMVYSRNVFCFHNRPCSLLAEVLAISSEIKWTEKHSQTYIVHVHSDSDSVAADTRECMGTWGDVWPQVVAVE